MPIFDPACPKIMKSTLSLPWICTSKQKNQLISSVHFKNTVNFWVLWPDWSDPFLTMPTQKISNYLLVCVDFCRLSKIQLLQTIHSWDKVNFRFLQPDWPHQFWTRHCPHPFLTRHTKIFFDQLLIYVNSYQCAKNRAIWLICSGDRVD